MFKEVAPKIANRPGGYTRVLRTGNRIGDNAETCIIELVDYNTTYTEVKQEVKKTATRRRRSSGAKKAAATAEAAALQKQNNHLVSNSSPHRGGARRAEGLVCSFVLQHEKNRVQGESHPARVF